MIYNIRLANTSSLPKTITLCNDGIDAQFLPFEVLMDKGKNAEPVQSTESNIKYSYAIHMLQFYLDPNVFGNLD